MADTECSTDLLQPTGPTQKADATLPAAATGTRARPHRRAVAPARSTAATRIPVRADEPGAGRVPGTVLPSVTATRYVTPLREGGSLPGLMEADDLGTYVVKWRAAGQGVRVLVAEVVCGELARALDLPVPALVTVDVAPELGGGGAGRRGAGAAAALGRAATSAWTTCPERWTSRPAPTASTRRWPGRVLWFDALVGNVDRSWRNPNMLFWHGRLQLIDHGAALTFHHHWPGAAAAVDPPLRRGAHALIECEPDVPAADAALAPRVTRALLEEVLAQVPDEWLEDDGRPPAAVRARYVDQLLARLAARDAWLPGLVAAAEAGGAGRRRAPRGENRPAVAGPAAAGGGDPAMSGAGTPSSTPCCASCRASSAGRRSTPASSSTAGSATTSAPGCTSTPTGCARWTRPRTPRRSAARCRPRPTSAPPTRAPARPAGRRSGSRFRWLTAPRSTVVQPGPVHTGLTADPDAEADRLLRLLVLPVEGLTASRRVGERRGGGRSASTGGRPAHPLSPGATSRSWPLPSVRSGRPPDHQELLMTQTTDAPRRPRPRLRRGRPLRRTRHHGRPVRRDRRGPAVPARGARRRHGRRRGFPHHEPVVRTPPSAAPAADGRAGRGPAGPLLGFQPIPPSTADEVVVPPGYTRPAVHPVGHADPRQLPGVRAGTPDAGSPSGNTAAEQAAADRHAPRRHALLPARTRRPRQRARAARAQPRVHRRALPAHRHDVRARGPAVRPPRWSASRRTPTASRVVEIAAGRGGQWSSVRSHGATGGSPPTRRWRSPARPPATACCRPRPTRPGARRSARSTTARNGDTPWGTYLTCEENFNGYFRVDAGALRRRERRARTRATASAATATAGPTHDQRFVVTAERPERAEPVRLGRRDRPVRPAVDAGQAHGAGPAQARGRLVHVAKDGRVVVYMGDDQVNEYVYKFVSSRQLASRCAPADAARSTRARSTSPVQRRRHRRVAPAGARRRTVSPRPTASPTRARCWSRPAWRPTCVGATPMDRPEWTAVDPRTGTVYLTLTNNTDAGQRRQRAPTRGRPTRGATSSAGTSGGGDHTATAFEWDLFLLAGAGQASGDGSTIDAEDAFGSPDGLWVDPDGRVVDPDRRPQPVGAQQPDAGRRPVPDATRGEPEIRRFLTGVIGCEVTGIAMTPDQRTLFINIQHPGENGGSTWPQPDGIDHAALGDGGRHQGRRRRHRHLTAMTAGRAASGRRLGADGSGRRRRRPAGADAAVSRAAARRCGGPAPGRAR